MSTEIEDAGLGKTEDAIVALQVGNVRHLVSLQTLNNTPTHSFLWHLALCARGQSQFGWRKVDDAFWIDRCGQRFHWILDWLRSGSDDVRLLEAVDTERLLFLRLDSEFFGLHELVACIDLALHRRLDSALHEQAVRYCQMHRGLAALALSPVVLCHCGRNHCGQSQASVLRMRGAPPFLVNFGRDFAFRVTAERSAWTQQQHQVQGKQPIGALITQYFHWEAGQALSGEQHVLQKSLMPHLDDTVSNTQRSLVRLGAVLAGDDYEWTRNNINSTPAVNFMSLVHAACEFNREQLLTSSSPPPPPLPAVLLLSESRLFFVLLIFRVADEAHSKAMFRAAFEQNKEATVEHVFLGTVSLGRSKHLTF